MMTDEGGTVTENSPDYTTIAISDVSLPYRREPYLQATFTDSRLDGFKAILIADTADLSDGRLATLITRFPRKVLAEMNTHRVFSRNSASSRARTLRAVIRGVIDDPYIPRFTSNMKGMSGKFTSLEVQKKATEAWLRGRDRAVTTAMELIMGDRYDPARELDDLLDEYYEAYRSGQTDGMSSVHKQDANRVLEPYMWHEAIISSSDWGNFFNLREDLSAADPAIYAIAVLMSAVLRESTPVDSRIHLPFASEESMLSGDEPLDSVRETLMRASMEAAQISYRDKSTANKSTASVERGESLLKAGHMSPFEHIAYRADAPAVAHLTDDLSGNLSADWKQLRHIYA